MIHTSGQDSATDSVFTRSRLAGFVVVCSAALLVALAWPLLTRRVFAYNDLVWFHLPIRYLYQQALRAGDTVLWTPAILSGFYVQGEGQLGAFHPLHQLLYRLLPLGVAFNLELISSYPVAFAGMWWFLRRLGFGAAAALTGAMLFAFSGFNLLHHHHMNMVAIVAHLPWLLAGADALIVEERGRARTIGFAALAGGLGSAFLLGFPQAIWWNSIALGVFTISRVVQTGRWGRLPACAAAGAIGVCLGGIQLLPSADAVAQSVRADVSPDFAMMYSLHPYNLLQVWSPYFFAHGAYNEREMMLFHEFGIYSGALLPIALIWTWIRRPVRPQRRALVVAATVLAALGLWLALGRYGGLAGLLAHLPVLQSLRAPVRYIVLAQFALAVLAAVTIEDLLAIGEGAEGPRLARTAALWIPAALGVVTLVTLNTRLLPYGPHTFANVVAALPGVAIVTTVTLLVWLAARRVRWALPALIVVTMLDLGWWGIRFIYQEPPRRLAALTRGIPHAPIEIEGAYAAVTDNGPFRSDLLVMRGYRLTTGYVGLYPAARHQLDGDEALRLSGTRWFFTPEGVRESFGGAVARVRVLGRDGRGVAGNARMAVDRPGRLVAHVDAPGPAILAFTERFHAGWTATIDDRPLPMVRVEGDFLGCVLDAGVHRVTLRFMPRSFVYGSIMSALGAVALAAVILAGRLSPRGQIASRSRTPSK